MMYTYMGSLGPQKPRFRYRPPHPARAVDGLIFLGGQNDAGRFSKRGGRCGILTGDHWCPENRASANDLPPSAGGRWLTFGAWPKTTAGCFRKRGVDAVYLPGITGPQTALPLSTPRPTRAVDGLLLVGGRNDGGGFLKNGAVDVVYPPGSMGRKPAPPPSTTSSNAGGRCLLLLGGQKDNGFLENGLLLIILVI